MQETINVLIASDINYAPYYGVMLTSLFVHNLDCTFDIHWLTDGSITQKEKEKFISLVKKYKSRLFIYNVNVDLIKKFPTIGHISLPSYYNLEASKLLPTTVHKIIYLDGDMVVNGNIRNLWDVDLSDYACAMVPNCAYYDESNYRRLNYESQWGYYNNGTTIYNIDYLREINFAHKAIDYILGNIEKIKWMDQDVINALLYDKTLALPLKYNFQTLFFEPNRWNSHTESFKKEILEAAGNPVIIHYCGRLKPWQYQYYMMPFGKLWAKTCEQSCWHTALCRKPYLKYIKHLLKRILKRSSLLELRNKEYIEESIRFS